MVCSKDNCARTLPQARGAPIIVFKCVVGVARAAYLFIQGAARGRKRHGHCFFRHRAPLLRLKKRFSVNDQKCVNIQIGKTLR